MILVRIELRGPSTAWLAWCASHFAQDDDLLDGGDADRSQASWHGLCHRSCHRSGQGWMVSWEPW
jgi:hypothetical protein